MSNPAIDISSFAPGERLRFIGDQWDSLCKTPDQIALTDAERAELGAEFVLAVDRALRPVQRFPESCEVFCHDTRACLVGRFPFEVSHRVEHDLMDARSTTR